MGKPTKNLLGLTFTRLTVLSALPKENGKTRWLCKCSCGTIKPILANNLLLQKSKSCGCLNKEAITSHGDSKTDFYEVWRGMLYRCNNPNAKEYKNYGARGIKVCEAWKDYLNFKKDMFPSYKKGLSIDRINVNDNYYKDNCKWSTLSEQLNNKRDTIYFDTPYGKLNLREIQEITGRPIDNLRNRAKNRNISYEELISENHQGHKIKKPTI